MKQGNQKAKGSSYERFVAGEFTKHYYKYDDGEVKRVPMSGGWDKRNSPGDLIAFKFRLKSSDEMVIDESFPFVVECKNWKDIKHFFSGLYSNESAIFDWIKQVSDDSVVSKKIPIVIFKLYRQHSISILKSTDFYKLKELFGDPLFKYYIIKRNCSFDAVDDNYENSLVFFLLKDFLNWIDWEHFKVQKYIRSIF